MHIMHNTWPFMPTSRAIIFFVSISYQNEELENAQQDQQETMLLYVSGGL